MGKRHWGILSRIDIQVSDGVVGGKVVRCMGRTVDHGSVGNEIVTGADTWQHGWRRLATYGWVLGSVLSWLTRGD